jgi:hypothetical protein
MEDVRCCSRTLSCLYKFRRGARVGNLEKTKVLYADKGRDI